MTQNGEKNCSRCTDMWVRTRFRDDRYHMRLFEHPPRNHAEKLPEDFSPFKFDVEEKDHYPHAGEMEDKSRGPDRRSRAERLRDGSRHRRRNGPRDVQRNKWAAFVAVTAVARWRRVLVGCRELTSLWSPCVLFLLNTRTLESVCGGQLTPGDARCQETTKKTSLSTMQSTKRQKKAIPDLFVCADECAKAIEEALEAMDPPLEVFEGILRLIAEFAQPHGELPRALMRG